MAALRLDSLRLDSLRLDSLRLDCADADDLAGLFVLDALAADETAAVLDHLATCDQAHASFAEMAAATGALASSADPVDAPPELRVRLMVAVATTPQVMDDVKIVVRDDVQLRVVDDVKTVSPAALGMTAPFSIDSARARRGPSRMGWIGLAAAAAIVIAALGAWNVSLQRQVSDAQGQVASLQQVVTTAQQHATDANAQVASLTQAVTTAQQQATDANSQLTGLQTQITDTQAQLTAALTRADTSDAQVASLQTQIQDIQVQVASYEQQIAIADDRVALIGQAVAAATATGSNIATLASTSPDIAAAGMAIFPVSGTGYIMVEGLPEIGDDQTYQAWYIAGGTPTSAGVLTAGPHGLAIVGGLAPISGTDTIALTVEPAGGVEQPTGTPVVVGKLPAAVALGGTTSIQ
ncbi:MAG: anti-sigma factor [Chloroflexi bacterium]|nr:anti-sigma factor [Chloroflexota bacterium]